MDPPSWIVCIAVVAILAIVSLCAWCVHCCKKRSLQKEKEKDAAAAAAASSSASVATGNGGSNIPFVYGMGGPSLKDFQAQVSTVVRLQNAKRAAASAPSVDDIDGGGAAPNMDALEAGKVETVKNDPHFRHNGGLANQREDVPYSMHDQRSAQQQKQPATSEPPPSYNSVVQSSSPIVSPSNSANRDIQAKDPPEVTRIDDQPASSAPKNDAPRPPPSVKAPTTTTASDQAPALTMFGRRPPPAPPFEKPPRTGQRTAGRGAKRANTLGATTTQPPPPQRQVTFQTQSLSSEGRQ